jgi:pimeloyl-ACP methyl ester carboxylesterase
MASLSSVSNAMGALAMASALACSSANPGVRASNPPDATSATPDAAIAGIAVIKVTIGAYVFDVRVAGPDNGPVVILLHGFPETSYEWRHQLLALAAAGYRAVAPDQRGYSPGARPSAVDQYGVLALVEDVVGLADAIGAQRFHLVGHDWGGGVAWGVAGLAPKRVISLTSVSVPHPDAFNKELADPTSCQYAASSYFDLFTTPAAVSYFLDNDAARLRSAYPGVASSDVDVYVEALGNVPTLTAALDWYRANISNRQFTTPVLGPVTVPTLMIWGDGDPYFCRATIDATAQFVTGPYRLEVLQGTNHWVPENAADSVDALLLGYLRDSAGD